MKSRIAALLIIMFLSLSTSNTVQRAYIPISVQANRLALGVAVSSFYVEGNAADLSKLKPDWLRIDFGQESNPLATPFQAYKAGGWSAVDLLVTDPIEAARDISGNIMVVMMYGGDCEAPTRAQLYEYADFLAAFASRYNVNRLEPWNEPEHAGGLASLYGCFGDAYINKYIDFIEYLVSVSPVPVGQSFAFNKAGSKAMLQAVCAVPGLSHCGIHNYAHYYGWPEPVYTWPGDLATAYDLAVSLTSLPVWITEYNERFQVYICGAAEVADPDFQAQQAEVLNGGFDVPAPVRFVFSYTRQLGSWDCTGLQGSLWEQQYTGVGYPW